MKKNSFTIVELLAVIVILGILLAVAIPTIQNIVNSSKQHSYEITVAEIIKGAKRYMIDNSDSIQYLDQYGVGFIKLSDLVTAGEFSGTITDPRTGSPFDSKATIKVTETSDGEYSYQFFDVSDISRYNVAQGANKPELTSNMIAVKWNGSNWIKEATPETDTSWYSYDTTNKKWANAVTVTSATQSTYQAASDGTVINMADIISMWVWIPRFIYRISSGWHTNTTGTLDIQFSIGTDDTRDSTVTLDTGIDASASNNKWTNHPAFTFGNTQLTGIWAAKFESSNDGSDNVMVIPGVTPWTYLSVNDIFTKLRSMETNSFYGWGTNGSNIDTHMMKNIEWGAIAYLSKSNYGKTTEIVVDGNEDMFTGGGSGSSYVTCTDQSSTGNVYGIYDISGGSNEYLAAYVDNNSSSLNTNGASVINANIKYRDVYTKGATDTQANNYNLTANKKGDAIYETSSAGSSGLTAWFGDMAAMPLLNSPWFMRGGFYDEAYDSTAGAFNYSSVNGVSDYVIGFRPIILVGNGL